jgi:Fic family protein
MSVENPSRLEPTRLEDPTPELIDVVAELVASSSVLGKALHPQTAANLADVVRQMNTYYSNLIEGHNTRPKDIERALAGDFDPDDQRRNLQIEAAAHVRVQREVDRMALAGVLPEPASSDFILWLHREFYRDASSEMLKVEGGGQTVVMTPGVWRSQPEHDNTVGRHIPPTSKYVSAFMQYFEERYKLQPLGLASRILAIPVAHHRLNYIHPFPDGNGRVSRLMSHAMALQSGIGANGLWSISRGLVRGLDSRNDYKQMMDFADTPRQSDLDGRGNLSLKALQQFSLWFLRVCLDQTQFMSSLFDLRNLQGQIQRYVERHRKLKAPSSALMEEALIRGEFERGEISRITGLPERTARRILSELIASRHLGSETEKGAVSLRFPVEALEDFFPKLYPRT